MSESYELTTIRDIFDKVPLDRIKDCCRELGTLLAQTRALADIAGPELFTISFPIVWTDDGIGEITTSVSCLDGEILTLETKPIQEPSHE